MTDITDEIIAQNKVERFVSRFENSYYLLACHVALPLVLTPELVNYLRIEFLRGEKVPWIAEADLLLSDLCRPAGYELYVMDQGVRAYLLKKLAQDPRFGQKRIKEIASLLLSYVKYLEKTNTFLGVKELETQKWGAMLYLDTEETVRKIALAISECVHPAELARLLKITQDFKEEIASSGQFQDFLDYAQLCNDLLREPEKVKGEQIKDSYQVGELELIIPRGISLSKVDSVDFESFSKPGRNYAIAMGINRYNHLPSLEYAVRDAEVMKHWFEQQNFSKVDVFRDRTSVRLKKFLAEEFEKPSLSPEDNLWFSFSGHSYLREGVEYLMLVDSKTEEITETAIPVNALVERLLSSGAGKVILFLDTDKISAESSLTSSSLFPIKGEQGLIVVSNANGRYEIDQFQQGVFTYALHGALSSTQGNLSINQLEKFLGDRLPELREQNNEETEIPQKLISLSNSNLGEWVPFPSDFEVCQHTTPTVNGRGEIIKKDTKLTRYFTKTLSDNVSLEMVAIPGGTFTMGSPEGEQGSGDNERPQHDVTVPSFFMGKYLVTQGQWRAIASQTDLKVELDLDPEPSHFKEPYKGKDRWERPVEQVSWYEAVEFCQRLSKLTERNYRLPSEAEWEYACRAGTTTPFYFGETITPELVNYDGNYTYGDGQKGEYREQTTPVGEFPPNAFGLYDMHGNLWEWCADDSHDDYVGAPTDGSAWVDSSTEDPTESYTRLRGGSWDIFPDYCRSAIRYYYLRRVDLDFYSGFRVVCDGGRTL